MDNTENKEIELNNEPENGEQRLNPSTGEVEVYYEGGWCKR